MAERTNVYEAMFIFDSNRFARERAGLPAEVEKAIKAAGGEVLVSRLWEERRLAYPIAGQRKGTYWLIYFRGPSSIADAAQSAMGNPRRHPAAPGAEGASAPGRSRCSSTPRRGRHRHSRVPAPAAVASRDEIDPDEIEN